MKLVWKNENGIVLKTQRVSDDIAPLDALTNTEWILDVGDIVEFQRDEIDFEDVFDTLKGYVDQVFRDIHDGYDINNGDITPDEATVLKDRVCKL